MNQPAKQPHESVKRQACTGCESRRGSIDGGVMLTETQQVTLRDILTTTGLSSTQVDEVLRLLSRKRGRVQLAFYYRAQGLTFAEVGQIIGVSRQVATRMVYEDCANIAIYLRDWGAFL